MTLLDPVTVLPRVGPVRAEKLAQAGLNTVGDVLRQFPRAFEHRKRCLISEAQSDQHSILEVSVIRAVYLGFGRSKRLEVATKDSSGMLKLVFFNPGRINAKALFTPNQTLCVVGKVERFNGNAQIIHPKVSKAEAGSLVEGIHPVYPQVKGVTSSEISGHVRGALQHLSKKPLIDPFAKDWLLAHRIAPLPDAFHWVHEENTIDSQKRILSLRRFAFEEVLSVQLSMQRRKRSRLEKAAQRFEAADAEQLFREVAPFDPTNAQVKALTHIVRDMSSAAPMSRLLQGDVGSGKTAVCAAACLLALRGKAQCAVLAPTDILVEQHLANFTKWFSRLGFRVAKLTGSQKESERRSVLAALGAGEIDIVVGTHALMSQGVAFRKLGLAIIDEQHRFGVAQRRALREKGESDGLTPHLLVMTATPIPRSLALTLYGDMSLSIIDELPKGRSPIETKVVQGESLMLAQRLAAKVIREDAQAYIIFPLVAESEKLDLRNATQAYEALHREFGKENIAMVHGQMKADEKDVAMKRFASGGAKILISTTVVEVGVDVPNASYMLIMNAERFGLSQLHQLRGRVGRGTKASFCYLATEKGAQESAQRRLDVMARTNNGFEIADEDLAIRGPGDLLGSRQAGLDLFSFFDFTAHGDLIEIAQAKAAELLDADPQLSAEWLKPFLERADTFLSC